MSDIDSDKDTPEDEGYKPPPREVVKGPDGSEGRVYVIPHPNLPTFQERFAKLVKRATKLGVEVPTYTELKVEPKVVKETVTDDTDDIDQTWGTMGHSRTIERVIMMHTIAVFHPHVVVSGWEFMAKLEHTEEGNILHVLEGKEIPFKYRDCDAWCDHCKTRRYRRDTFVLHSTTGSDEWQQVGRNCLADFLGRDAERYADAAELYYTLDALGSASEEVSEGGGGGGPRYEMLDRYLTYVAEVISHVGWKSRGSAFKYGGVATADIALRHLYRRRYDPRTDLFREPTEKSAEVAKAATEWADALTDEEVTHSDYLWNIRIIARRGVVGDKQFGFAASIVSSYQRHIGELEVRARKQTQDSQWVGEVGERRLFHLLVEKVVEVGGDFGQFPSQLHIMSDDDGNKFIWFAHGVTLDSGVKHWIKGTIKKHNEREGVKQNMLSRCEEVEMKSYLVVYQGQEYRFIAPDMKAAKKMLPSVLDIPKVPRGLPIAEETAPAPTPAPVVEQPTPPGSWRGDTDTTWESVAPQPSTPTLPDSEEKLPTFED